MVTHTQTKSRLALINKLYWKAGPCTISQLILSCVMVLRLHLDSASSTLSGIAEKHLILFDIALPSPSLILFTVAIAGLLFPHRLKPFHSLACLVVSLGLICLLNYTLGFFDGVLCLACISSLALAGRDRVKTEFALLSAPFIVLAYCLTEQFARIPILVPEKYQSNLKPGVHIFVSKDCTYCRVVDKVELQARDSHYYHYIPLSGKIDLIPLPKHTINTESNPNLAEPNLSKEVAKSIGLTSVPMAYWYERGRFWRIPLPTSTKVSLK